MDTLTTPDWMTAIDSPTPWPCDFGSFSKTAGGKLSIGVKFACDGVPRDLVRQYLCKKTVVVCVRDRIHTEESFDQKTFAECESSVEDIATCGPLSDNTKCLGIRLSFSENAPYDRLFDLSGREGHILVKAFGNSKGAPKPEGGDDEDDDGQMIFDFEPSKQWRNEPISKLRECGISEKLCDTLHDASITTLGELQDKMTSHGMFWAKDIKGIGEGKRVNIEDAFNEFVRVAEDVNAEDIEGDDGDEVEEYDEDE